MLNFVATYFNLLKAHNIVISTKGEITSREQRTLWLRYVISPFVEMNCTDKHSYENDCHSPDSSENPFAFSFKKQKIATDSGK
nr:hypothetical protein [uncultured Flavobacterium sp.]